MTFSIKFRLMSPDRDTKPTVTELQHTPLKCEEGKMCQHHHITCQDTPSAGLGHHTWTQLPDTLNFASISTMSVLCQALFTHMELSLKGSNSLLPTKKFC